MALRRIQLSEGFRFHRLRHSPNRHRPSRRQTQPPDLFNQDDFFAELLEVPSLQRSKGSPRGTAVRGRDPELGTLGLPLGILFVLTPRLCQVG